MVLSPLVDLDLADLDRQLRINVRGTFVVDQQAPRRLRPAGDHQLLHLVVRLRCPVYTLRRTVARIDWPLTHAGQGPRTT